MVSYRNYKTQNSESNWQYSVGHCAQRKVHSRAAAIVKNQRILNFKEKKIFYAALIKLVADVTRTWP